jgi:hypothetical protein
VQQRVSVYRSLEPDKQPFEVRPTSRFDAAIAQRAGSAIGFAVARGFDSPQLALNAEDEVALVRRQLEVLGSPNFRDVAA